MISENDVEMIDEKDGVREAPPNVDMKSRYILKEISNVRWFDPVKQEWIDIGYEGPVSFNCKGEMEV